MITLILWIALLGLVVYLVITYVPMPEVFKRVIVIVAVIAVILYLMAALGIADMPVPRIR